MENFKNMTSNIKSIEIEGFSVEDAINKALKKLGVERHEIEVKVLCEESKGLFGMQGAKPAKIRVFLKKI
jgi:spoIIIJ-associated protein